MIDRYRPRIEGLFARIERWTRRGGRRHALAVAQRRTTSSRSMARTMKSRIAERASRRTSSAGASARRATTRATRSSTNTRRKTRPASISRRRTSAIAAARSQARKVNRYLKRIRYGNRIRFLTAQGERPRFVDAAMREDAGWMFELVFDYGEHDRADAASRSMPGTGCAATIRSRVIAADSRCAPIGCASAS